jgi:hypothetical protein
MILNAPGGAYVLRLMTRWKTCVVIECLAPWAFDRQAVECPGLAQFAVATAATDILHFCHF